jgi:hypothetical protein
VARKQGESPISVRRADLLDGPGKAWEVELDHADFPGWSFVVGFSPNGTPAGFRMTPTVELPPHDPLTGRHDGLTALDWWVRWNMAPDAPALTARMLRSVPLGKLQAVARESWERRGENTARVYARNADRSPASAMAATLRPVVDAMELRPGRRGRTDREYAALSTLYVASMADRVTLPELASSLHLSPGTLRNQLYEARRRGLLTAAPKGRSGGELTPKGRELLQKER